MELVIKLSKEDYEIMKHNVEIHNPLCPLNQEDMVTIIANGTPLPKHGRLIDADALKKYYPHDTDWEYPVNTNEYVSETIDNEPTIIEADDTEGEE